MKNINNSWFCQTLFFDCFAVPRSELMPLSWRLFIVFITAAYLAAPYAPQLLFQESLLTRLPLQSAGPASFHPRANKAFISLCANRSVECVAVHVGVVRLSSADSSFPLTQRNQDGNNSFSTSFQCRVCFLQLECPLTPFL